MLRSNNPHEGLPYHAINKGKNRRCYQLHKPKDCRQIFPPTKENIHKCVLPKLEYVKVNYRNDWQPLLVPKSTTNYYPMVIDKGEYERLKTQAKIQTEAEILRAMKDQEEATQKQLKESLERKERLRKSQLPQPGAKLAATEEEREINGPDQNLHTLTRAELLRAENLKGPQLCTRTILASQCHAIRDAQVVEKALIKKEMEKEDRRLDEIMEENRQAAIAREKAAEERRQRLNMEHREGLMDQQRTRQRAKIMETARIEEESIRVNQANIAMQIEEAEKLQEKHRQQLKLKLSLDQSNAELLYYKQRAEEEERIMNLRIENFQKAKREREEKFKREADAIKQAKAKDISDIAANQKAQQELQKQLEYLRNMKIQEDVEREYRRKERDNAIKRNREKNELHEARVAQINTIHKMIAREIALEETAFNNAARQNEEYLKQKNIEDDKRKAAIEKHRQAIMQQINEKERAREETRQRIHNEGVALRLEQEEKDAYEAKVIRTKIAKMREQKMDEHRIRDVLNTMKIHGYKV